MTEIYYRPEHSVLLANTESRHFWFAVRGAVIQEALRLCRPAIPPPGRMLEVGCGTGYVLGKMREVFPRARLTGIDAYGEGLAKAKEWSDAELIQGDFFTWTPGERYDLIGCFDVLEHMENDREALERMRELMTPAGWLVLTVPAFSTLWSAYDEAAGHLRRYTREEMIRRVEAAGYRVVYATYFMGLLYPLLRFRAFLARRGWVGEDPDPVKSQLKVMPLINGLFRWLLTAERLLVRARWCMGAGSSLLVVAVSTANASREAGGSCA
jgi:SAM-dependent methyltransferase